MRPNSNIQSVHWFSVEQQVPVYSRCIGKGKTFSKSGTFVNASTLSDADVCVRCQVEEFDCNITFTNIVLRCHVSCCNYYGFFFLFPIKAVIISVPLFICSCWILLGKWLFTVLLKRDRPSRYHRSHPAESRERAEPDGPSLNSAEQIGPIEPHVLLHSSRMNVGMHGQKWPKSL